VNSNLPHISRQQGLAAQGGGQRVPSRVVGVQFAGHRLHVVGPLFRAERLAQLGQLPRRLLVTVARPLGHQPVDRGDDLLRVLGDVVEDGIDVFPVIVVGIGIGFRVDFEDTALALPYRRATRVQTRPETP